MNTRMRQLLHVCMNVFIALALSCRQGGSAAAASVCRLQRVQLVSATAGRRRRHR